MYDVADDDRSCRRSAARPSRAPPMISRCCSSPRVPPARRSRRCSRTVRCSRTSSRCRRIPGLRVARRRRRARGAAAVPRVRSQRRARSLVDGRRRACRWSITSIRPRRSTRVRADGVTVVAAVPAIFEAWLALDADRRARRRVRARAAVRLRCGAAATGARRRDARPVRASTCTTGTGSPRRRRSSPRARSRRSRASVRSGRRCRASRCASSTPTVTTCSKAIRARSSSAGPTCSPGYWGDPDATARVLDADGWLHTGDVGVADDDGWLSLVERAKDVVIVSGFNVYPGEVEHVLAQHPDVADVAVVGEPHPRTGETVVAYVVAKPGTASRSGRAAAPRGPAARALQAPDARRARRRAAAIVRGQVAAPRAVVGRGVAAAIGRLRVGARPPPDGATPDATAKPA